jgi:hypothetical protein
VTKMAVPPSGLQEMYCRNKTGFRTSNKWCVACDLWTVLWHQSVSKANFTSRNSNSVISKAQVLISCGTERVTLLTGFSRDIKWKEAGVRRISLSRTQILICHWYKSWHRIIKYIISLKQEFLYLYFNNIFFLFYRMHTT